MSTEVKDSETQEGKKVLRPVVQGETWCLDITVGFHSCFDPHQ